MGTLFIVDTARDYIAWFYLRKLDLCYERINAGVSITDQTKQTLVEYAHTRAKVLFNTVSFPMLLDLETAVGIFDMCPPH